MLSQNQEFKTIQNTLLEVLPDELRHQKPLAFETAYEVQVNSQLNEACSHLLQDHKAILKTSGETIELNKPLRVAVLFSGGPAAGGHNVLVGLKHVLQAPHQLLGVKQGPKGLLEGDLFEINNCDEINFTGGFDYLGTDRTKISTPEQFAKVAEVVEKHKLNGIVIIGGDDSNTNAALLAEYLYGKCVVVGVPKTIDGDLQYQHHIPMSFGFDTATKIYSELVANLIQDSRSTKKYWHFIKLMGRNASHVSLEIALKTQPALCLITEEIKEKNLGLEGLLDELEAVMLKRQANGLDYGVVLIPEGVVDCLIPEGQADIGDDLKSLLKDQDDLYDSHGNLKVSDIPVEELLASGIQSRHPKRWSIKTHFFGYEGRCGIPSFFDAFYTTCCGALAASAIANNKTGYVVAVSGFDTTLSLGLVPLTQLMHQELRKGKPSLVIKKQLVELDSKAFEYFKEHREQWAIQDRPCYLAPRQFFGSSAYSLPLSLQLNQGYESDQLRCVNVK